MFPAITSHTALIIVIVLTLLQIPLWIITWKNMRRTVRLIRQSEETLREIEKLNHERPTKAVGRKISEKLISLRRDE